MTIAYFRRLSQGSVSKGPYFLPHVCSRVTTQEPIYEFSSNTTVVRFTTNSTFKFFIKRDCIMKTMYSKCNQILSRTCEVPGSNLYPEIGYYKLKLSVSLLSTSKQLPDTTPTSNTTASFQSIISSFLINHLIIRQHITLVSDSIGK